MQTFIDLEEFANELTRRMVEDILQDYTPDELEQLIEEMEATMRRRKMIRVPALTASLPPVKS